MTTEAETPKKFPVRKIVFILFAAVFAHFVASYICLLFTIQRIDQMGQMAAQNKQITIPKRFKLGAPVYIFTLLNAWRKFELETPRGLTFLYGMYVMSAGGVFVLTLLAPKLVTNDEKPRSRTFARGAAKKPAAAPAAVAAPAAPAAAPIPVARPATVTPPPPARPATSTPPPPRPTTVTPPPPARPAATPPPPRPTTVTPPPPARGGAPPPPRTVTPPPPARGTTPPRPRRDG